MKKYAFVEYGGQVLSIETRCSGLFRDEVAPDELAVEDIVHLDLIHRYVEIPAGVKVTEGMLYSDGVFKENPESPEVRIAVLENQVAVLLGQEV